MDFSSGVDFGVVGGGTVGVVDLNVVGRVVCKLFGVPCCCYDVRERSDRVGERRLTGIDFSNPKFLTIFGRAEGALIFDCVIDSTGDEIFLVIPNGAVFTCWGNDNTSREEAGC